MLAAPHKFMLGVFKALHGSECREEPPHISFALLASPL